MQAADDPRAPFLVRLFSTDLELSKTHSRDRGSIAQTSIWLMGDVGERQALNGSAIKNEWRFVRSVRRVRQAVSLQASREPSHNEFGRSDRKSASSLPNP